MKPSIAELAAVTVVGLALAYAAKKTSVAEKAPLLAPALLYTLGFYVATKRPADGYAQLSK
jgi:hypothetical protein